MRTEINYSNPLWAFKLMPKRYKMFVLITQIVLWVLIIALIFIEVKR